MKITKGQINNLLFIVLIAVVLFTPVGTQLKVYVNRLLAGSPSVESVENRATLGSYQWQLTSIKDKTPYKLSDDKGKVILVNFWATWCPPCIAEMPSMQKLFNDYHDKIVFLFVTNEKAGVVEKFLGRHEYTFPVFNPLSNPPEKLNASSIPTTYLIDKNGNIVIDKTGAADWNSKKTRELIEQLMVE